MKHRYLKIFLIILWLAFLMHTYLWVLYISLAENRAFREHHLEWFYLDDIYNIEGVTSEQFMQKLDSVSKYSKVRRILEGQITQTKNQRNKYRSNIFIINTATNKKNICIVVYRETKSRPLQLIIVGATEKDRHFIENEYLNTICRFTKNSHNQFVKSVINFYRHGEYLFAIFPIVFLILLFFSLLVFALKKRQNINIIINK